MDPVSLVSAGRPSALLCPIHRCLAAALPRLCPPGLRDNRDRLIIALANICCPCLAELAARQTCNIWSNFHSGYSIPGYQGTAAVHIGRHKNDCERKGHRPAIGRARDHQLDLAHQLLAWFRLRVNHFIVSPLCTERQNPAF